MKNFIFFLLLFNQIFGQNIFQDFGFNPFKSKSKINYSLNDISNYPIGIFSISKKYLEYEVSFETSFDKIIISEKILNGLSSRPYVSTFDEYINSLYLSNQSFNFSQPFILSASDTTISK